MDVAKSDQLGTSERIQKKIEKIKQFAREAPVSSDDEVQGLKDELNVSQTRERELLQRVKVTFLTFMFVVAVNHNIPA